MPADADPTDPADAAQRAGLRQGLRAGTHAGEEAARLAPAIFCFVVVALTALWWLLERVRPLPFASSGDSNFYYLPSILAANAPILDTGMPRIEWALGQGWNPFESGQVGVGYPPYLLALLLARAWGDPLVVLEVSALLHGVLGVIVVWTCGRSLSARVRALTALAVVVQPGPVLYGMASHDFLTPMPWIAGLGLLLTRTLLLEDDEARKMALRRRWIWLTVFEILLFWSSHLQMFVVANVVFTLLVLGLAGTVRQAVVPVAALVAATVPLVVPMLWFAQLAQRMHGSSKAAHEGPIFFKTSASFVHLLEWTLLGGARAAGRVWHQGWLYLCPTLIAVLLIAALALVRQRRLRPALASLAVLVVLAPAMVPKFLWQPLSFWSMRWPEKTTMITGPLSVLVVALVLEARPRLRTWLLGLGLAAGVVAVFSGDPLLPLRSAHREGIPGILDETRACLQVAGVPEGARVALVGPFTRFPMSEKNPLVVYGLGANTPLLVGRGSAHLYEPMEPDETWLGHAKLGPPWRQTVDPAAIAARDEKTLETLRGLGVSSLVSNTDEPLRALGVPVRCTDRQGSAVFVVRTPGDVVAFPWATVNGRAESLSVLDDGALETRTSSAEPPGKGGVVRPLRWERLPDGRWRGHPALLPTWIVVGTLALAALALCIGFALARRTPVDETPNP